MSFTLSALLYGSQRRIRHPHVKEEPTKPSPERCTWMYCCMKNNSSERSFRVLSLWLLLIIGLVEFGCHIASRNTSNYLTFPDKQYLTLLQGRCPSQQRVFSRNHTHSGDREEGWFRAPLRRCTRTLHSHISHNLNRVKFPASQRVERSPQYRLRLGGCIW